MSASLHTMRIALSLELLDPRRGGAEGATLRLIRALAARGHEVHVLTRAVSCELPASVQVHLIPARRPTVALRHWAFANGVARVLRENSFDVSVACGRGYAEDAVWSHNGGQAAASRGETRSYYFSPFRQWLRRGQDFYSPKGWAYRTLERKRFAGRSPRILSVSQMVADEFQRDYGADPKRTRVVYNQVELERFGAEKIRPLRAAARAALGLTEGELAILFVGQNFKRKGLRTLVEAAGELQRQGRSFQVLVAGSTPERGAPYARLARQLGCAERLRFLGQHARVEELYAAADVLCLPTFYDPCALVVVEGMAGGLPVITSRYNGASEMLHHGIDGFVLQEPSDTAEFAGVLAKLFDPKLREQISAAAIATARAVCLQNPANDIVAAVEDLARTR